MLHALAKACLLSHRLYRSDASIPCAIHTIETSDCYFIRSAVYANVCLTLSTSISLPSYPDPILIFLICIRGSEPMASMTFRHVDILRYFSLLCDQLRDLANGNGLTLLNSVSCGFMHGHSDGSMLT